MSHDYQADVDAVSRIPAVPTILDVVCRTTGMGFAAVARVTEDRWIACSVKDDIAFGLAPGGELEVETTICHEIRQSRQPVIIDDVAEDPDYCNHHTPALYGIKSYISMPIVLMDGTFFGTLCAIDQKPAKLRNPGVVGMFKLFADMIAYHLDALQRAENSRAILADEREASALREQFIAVLGHDLRNPLAAISSGMHLLEKEALSERGAGILALVRNSVGRMTGLIDNVMDFARGRLGGGITLQLDPHAVLPAALEQVAAEIRAGHPERSIETHFEDMDPVACDPVRISQLFSNLLGNAVQHGAADKPVVARASTIAGELKISVSNSGDPIAPDAMERLFAPFTRGEAGSRPQGLGLGLYIAAQVADAHGGRIEVSSTPEETCFTFRMPQAGAKPDGN